MDNLKRQAGDAEDPRDALLRAQARQIEAQAAMLERQARWLDTLMAGQGIAGGTRGPVALPAPVAPTPAAAPARDELSFGELWTRYLDSLGPKKWKKNVVSMMRYVLRHFAPTACVWYGKTRRRPIVFHGPDIAAKDIRPQQWGDFMDPIINERRLTVGFRRLMLKRTKACLNYGEKTERLDKNPLRMVDNEPKRPKRETHITDRDLEILRPHACPLGWAYAVTMNDSGMRPGEVRLLQLDQVDPVTYETQLSWTTTKSKKTRLAWVTPRCLEAWAALPRPPGNRFVFAAPGTILPYGKTRLWEAFRAAADAAGLRPAPGDRSVRPYDNRRGFSTKFLQAGGKLTNLQAILGHAEVTTTIEYVNVVKEDLKRDHSLIPSAQEKTKRKPAKSKAPKIIE